jgi:hypothetical protein
MTFAPGCNNGSEPYGVANVTQGYRYNVSPVSELDMAICVLDQDIGESCGWVATVWNTADGGYNQGPLEAFLGCAGYSNSTNPADDTQSLDIGSNFVITVPAESGHFKLLNFPVLDTALYGAVLWTHFNNMACCAGVMSGIDGNDPPSGLGFAGGEALGDLLTAVRISTSTAFRIVLTHHRVFSAGVAISWSARSTHISPNCVFPGCLSTLPDCGGFQVSSTACSAFYIADSRSSICPVRAYRPSSMFRDCLSTSVDPVFGMDGPYGPVRPDPSGGWTGPRSMDRPPVLKQ